MTEVAIASFVLALVGGAIVAVMFQGQYSYQSQQDIIEVTQDARIALDQIMTFIRQAGSDKNTNFPSETNPFGHAHTGVFPIEVQGPARIVIYSNITGKETAYGNTGDPDNDLADLYEEVDIAYVGNEIQIKIKRGEAARTLAENVSSFSFTFMNGQGASVTNPSSNEGLIVKVGVQMKIQTPQADLRTGKVQSITLQSEAMLRSRAFISF